MDLADALDAVVALLCVFCLLRLLLFSNKSFDHNRKNKEQKEKLIVVLDLDECLVHVDREGKVIQSKNEGEIESFECYFAEESAVDRQKQQNESATTCQVFLRPGWKEFLLPLVTQRERYELHIFTASEASYAKPILAELERRLQGKLGSNGNTRILQDKNSLIKNELIFSEENCWYRDSCRTRRFLNHDFTFKDLSILQRPLHRTVLVDDDPTNFTDNPDHGIPIRPFLGDDPWDDSLNKVGQLLQELLEENDVKTLLRKRFDIAETCRAGLNGDSSVISDQWEYLMNHIYSVRL